jgi:hypothetical protein
MSIFHEDGSENGQTHTSGLSTHDNPLDSGSRDTEPPQKTMMGVELRLDALLVHDDAADEDQEHHNRKH